MNQTTTRASHETVPGFANQLGRLFLIGAIVLTVIGLMEGLGLTNIVNFGETAGVGGGNSFNDGALFLIPAIVTATLAFALRSGTASSTAALEHGAAFSFGIGTAAFAVVGALSALGAFDNTNPQADGAIWGLTAIATAIMTAVLLVRRQEDQVNVPSHERGPAIRRLPTTPRV